jgi:alpha,alpha-trehalose phosphorylase (configuration-retaining)
MEKLEKEYPDIMNDVSVSRVPPIDQRLNALMSCSKIACQLSSREGFEVKVSEAFVSPSLEFQTHTNIRFSLHKSKPIIATLAGGIPLQVKHGESGFLVEPGDAEKAAEYMHQLLTDKDLYDRMSKKAPDSISDEVGTVGNALCWLYLATKMAKGEEVKANGKWINDLAREAAGEPYDKDEVKLPRDLDAAQR